MAAAVAAPPDLPPSDSGHGLAADNNKTSPHLAASQVHTPPETDETSHSHKDDDAASSSSLSDLGDIEGLGVRFDDEEFGHDTKFEDAARAGAEAEQFSEVKPDRYENGVPIFTPNMEEFKDFEKYVKGVNPYGMQSGIVLIDPPAEWKQARKALDKMVKTIKIKNPITQEFHGAQGIYTQRNMEKQRSYNLPQWKAICESTENQPPAKRGEKRMNADKLLGRGVPKTKRGESSPLPDGQKRRPGRPRTKPIKDEAVDNDSSLMAPPTPTSPETKPAVPAGNDDSEVEDATDPTPSKKRGKKAAPKPKGRQPKAASRKDSQAGGGKSSETTVAARRLRNVGAAAEEIDEEAFEDFDYRVYDNEQWTAERCDELEEKYWKSLNFSNPMYAADMPGSLFDEETKEWNVAKLPNLLDLLGQPIPGVNTAYLYLGMWRATFAWHLEDVDLYSINYIHFGAPKQWYSISQRDAPKFESAMKSIWSSDAKNCHQFLRHKTYLVSPSLLKSKYGVTVNKVVHREGQFVITFPIGYHSGYNLGYNCAESVNFAIEDWLQYGKTSKKCECEADSVFIDVDWFIRRMNGEPTPEYEEIEVTDDEDDLDDAIDLPTPPGSDRGKVKMPQKRKRPTKDLGPNKKAKKLIKIRKVSKHQPCCLCPNDFAYDELLPTTGGEKAHRRCAMYTAETYIANVDGVEKVFGVENVSKDRLELKCYDCRQKKGSCFQCSSAKCARAYHATCAAQAGVQVDIGEIAVWHEGVEYRDMGIDFRCRMHRTTKRARVSTELAICNYAAVSATSEFDDYLANLKPLDLVQWQATHSDDIEAGVVVRVFDSSEGGLLVKVLPEQKRVREIDPTWLLFVDSSTSCLQKPSATALDLPEELLGKASSIPESSEKKPSAGDAFSEGTEWGEFSSAEPAKNKAQKPVNLSKAKQLWHYLGQSSTETKAQYTSDPTRRVHDPTSNFLDTVEPPKPIIMAPPPQPRRQSLAATYPMINVAARNAAMAVQRQQMLERTYRQQQGMPVQPVNTQAFDLAMKQAREKMLEAQRHMNISNPAQYQDLLAHQGARANQQSAVARQEQKADSLGTQARRTSMSTPGIGIDREAVERQRQFQQQAALQSRSMSQEHNDRIPSPLRQYHPPLPNYNAMDAAGHNNPMNGYGSRPGMQFTDNWMQSPGSNSSMDVTKTGSPAPAPIKMEPPQLSIHSPMMSNGPGFRQFSPSFDPQQNVFGPSPSPQPQSAASSNMNLMNGYQDHIQIRNETSRAENVRAAMANFSPPQSQSSFPLVPPSVNTTTHEHQRRISNPAYPFKSPETLKAQKEAEKNSPPGSRPGSSTMTQKPFPLASPRMRQDPLMRNGMFGPNSPILSAGEMPQFINPNATQITPPGSRGSFSRSGGGSQTMPSPMMGMAALLPAVQHQSHPQMHIDFDSTPAPPTAIIPDERLVAALQPRETLEDGRLVNDRAVPRKWGELASRGSFWDKVAGYFVDRHRQQDTVYWSPYANRIAGEQQTIAGQWYEGLSDPEKAKVDSYRKGV